MGPGGLRVRRPAAAVQKFYAGASFIVRNYSHTLAPWMDLHGIVDGLMNGYEVPGNCVADLQMTAVSRDTKGEITPCRSASSFPSATTVG